MKLRTGFILCGYLLAAMGLACLGLSRLLPFPIALFLYAALAGCLVLELKGRLPIEPPVKPLAFKWGLLALPVLYFGFRFPLLELVTGFLVLILFTRLLFKTELNDYLFGYLISLVCLLIGALHIQKLVFAFLFFAFYLALCLALLFYNLMAERVGSQCPPAVFKTRGHQEFAGRSLFGLTSGLLFLSLTLTIFIFLSFPRTGLGFLSIQADHPISGFSETVTLGDVGKIKQNPAVVMRVEYTQNGKPYRPKSRIFWRGVVLDHYDGKTWSSTVPVGWGARNRPPVGVHVLQVPDPVNPVEQTVYVESFDTDILFTHGLPLVVKGRFNSLLMNQNFVLQTRGQRSGPRKITLISDIGRPNRSFPQKLPRPDPRVFPDRYLQLPPLGDRIHKLAQDITRHAATPVAKANHILNHFAGFGYSLEMAGEPDEHALDHFLFTRQQGHCEYFASAMVVLLRLADIPARLVNGFAGTEWNDWGQYLIIRQTHAHSWVEAYLPGRGWTVYDPTPPDPSITRESLTNPLTRSLDLLRLNWQRYILRYSRNDQREILNAVRSGGHVMVNQVRNLRSLDPEAMFQWIEEHAHWILILLGLGGILYLVRSPVGRTGRWRLRNDPFPVRLYTEMLRRVEKLGYSKPPGWTHREFLDRLSSLPEEQYQTVQRITTAYELSRFAGRQPEKTEQKKWLAAARRI